MNPVMISRVVAGRLTAFTRNLVLGAAALVITVFTLSSTSCATSKGFGQDVQKVGGKIEQAAERTGGAD